MHLFGTRVTRRQPRLARRDSGVEQLGDSKIQQLGCSAGCHQNVSRLQIAVHDQIQMRIRDGRADFEIQLQARARIEAAHESIDRLSLHQFHD